MISPQEHRYQTESLALADSTVIFHSIVAQGINRDLQAKGFEIGHDPQTHKYQMNLCGLYHEADHREVAAINGGNPYMQVWVPVDGVSTTMSLDLDLLNDPLYGELVRLQYQFGSSNFELLRDSYPNQQELLFGLLFPLDMSTVLDAQDGDVLACGGYIRKVENGRVVYRYRAGSTQSTLLYANETTLIQDLERWVKNMMFRWFVDGYGFIQSMYTTSFHAMLYSLMPARLDHMRLKRCGSAEVHPYHMRAKLDSVAGIGYVVDAFDLSTSYYLYRNAYALNARKGNESTLLDLVDQVAVRERMPLVGYEFKHFPDTTDEEGRVVKRLSRMSLNQALSGYAPHYIDLPVLMNNQISGFGLNPDPANIEERAHRYNSNNALTKHLMTAVGMDGLSSPFTAHEILIGMWIHGVCEGRITNTIFIEHPHSGKTIALSAKQGLALAYYTFSYLMTGTVAQTVPRFIIDWLPKSGQLSRMGTSGFKTLEEYQADFPKIEASVLPLLRMGSEIPYQHVTADSLYQAAQLAYKDLERRYRHTTNTSDGIERGQRQQMMRQMYWHGVEVVFPASETLSEAGLSRATGIDLTSMSTPSVIAWLEKLIQLCTGDSNQQRDALLKRHRAFIGVLNAFLSYTVRVSDLFIDQRVLRSQQPTARTHATFEDIDLSVRAIPGWSNNQINFSGAIQLINRQSVANVDIDPPPATLPMKLLPSQPNIKLYDRPGALRNHSHSANTTITLEVSP